MSDYMPDPDYPLVETEVAYRRGYVQGAFAACDHASDGVSWNRIGHWLDKLAAWHHEADMARRQERIWQSQPPVL